MTETMTRAARIPTLLLLGAVLVACGTRSTQQVEENYDQLDIDRVTLLPMHDMRLDHELPVVIDDDTGAMIAGILAYKNYEVDRAANSDYLELNGLKDYGINAEQLRSHTSDWIRSVEPRYANWLFLPVLDTAYRTSEPEESVTVAVTGYLFDTQNGRIVWQSTEATTYGSSVDDAAKLSSAAFNATRELVRKLPRNPDVPSRTPLLKQKVYTVALAEVLPVPVPGANDATVMRILEESISSYDRVELGYSPNGGEVIEDLPELDWSDEAVARPLAESAIAVGRLSKADAVMLFSVTFNQSLFRGDVYLVDVDSRTWYHRQAKFSDISIRQRVPRVEQTVALVLEDFVNASDRRAHTN